MTGPDLSPIRKLSAEAREARERLTSIADLMDHLGPGFAIAQAYVEEDGRIEALFRADLRTVLSAANRMDRLTDEGALGRAAKVYEDTRSEINRNGGRDLKEASEHSLLAALNALLAGDGQ